MPRGAIREAGTACRLLAGPGPPQASPALPSLPSTAGPSAAARAPARTRASASARRPGARRRRACRGGPEGPAPRAACSRRWPERDGRAFPPGSGRTRRSTAVSDGGPGARSSRPAPTRAVRARRPRCRRTASAATGCRPCSPGPGAVRRPLRAGSRGGAGRRSKRAAPHRPRRAGRRSDLPRRARPRAVCAPSTPQGTPRRRPARRSARARRYASVSSASASVSSVSLSMSSMSASAVSWRISWATSVRISSSVSGVRSLMTAPSDRDVTASLVTFARIDSRAAMDLYEYQGKELFRRFGIPVSEGRLATTPEEARAAAQELGGQVVVKAQVLTGGRGKAGGIRLADGPDEAEARAREILGLDIRGHVVRKLWIERASDIAKEYYLSVTFDRGVKKPLVMLTKEGGIEIEQVAAENPGALARLHVDPLAGFHPFAGRRLVYAAGIDDPNEQKQVLAIVG